VSGQHTFVAWAVERYAKEDTPLGDLARELDRSWECPTSGDGAELRESLEGIGAPEWMLYAFDTLWAEFELEELP
jgi:hypothetical protein